MSRVRLLATVAVLALMPGACGSAPPATGHVTTASNPRVAESLSPVPNPCPLAQDPARYTAAAPSNRNLAIVRLGSSATVVRDITDISHPTTVATLDVFDWLGNEFLGPKFASASDVSYVIEPPSRLVRMPFSNSPKTQAAGTCTMGRYAWSPDGQSVTFVSLSPLGWHLVADGVDRLIANLDWREVSGDPNQALFDYRVAFSPDGRLVSLVHYAGTSDLQVRRLDGTLVSEVTSRNYPGKYMTMSVWSGDGLYFEDSKGISVWRDGRVSTFLSGATWMHARSSPAGGQIVYTSSDKNGLDHVFVVDTGTRKVRQLATEARVAPFFLTPRYVWYKGERLCAAGDPREPCAYDKTIPTAKTYIYDLQDGSESESLITNVADVWPHGA